MTNYNTSLHNTMNASDSQVERKRKVSESSTSCSSLDSESDDDSDNRKSSELRKIARLGSHSRYSNFSSSSDNQASSSKQESSSDSDPEHSEKCPICLKAFKFQTLGITDTCSHHTFCLACLEEWSKTKKTCPVDRKEYKSILVLDSCGNVSKQLPIKSIANTTSFVTWPPPFEPTFCEVCGLCNNENMLICEGCGMGYHLYCLIPPMENHPTGIWLCNDCWYYYNY